MTCWLGRAGESRGQSGQNEVNNTTISLHLSRSLYCLLVASRADLRVIHSSYFRISVSFGLRKIYPLLRGKLPTLPLRARPTCSPLKAPILLRGPYFSSLLGPSPSYFEALQGVPQMAGSSCSPTFDAQYRPACPICWEHIQTPSNEC